jgi:hypothetical protein
MSFRRERHTVVRGALSEETVVLACSYVELLRPATRLVWHGETGSWNCYGDPLGESILLRLRKLIEQNTGYSLVPTYSFLRRYGAGSVLRKHSDRPACEVSATLCLGYDSLNPWPIYLESRLGDKGIELGPGDMLLYMGSLVNHWRERFEGKWQNQLFLHYVIADGALSEFMYDLRPRLGVPIVESATSPHRLFRARQGLDVRPDPDVGLGFNGMAYLGMYKQGNYRTAKITSIDNSLYLELYERHARSGLLPLRPVSPTQFINEKEGIIAMFEGDPTPKLVLEIDGRCECAHKILYAEE